MAGAASARPLSPVPLAIWVVSDGRAGIENQALGLAEAVQRLTPAEAAYLRAVPLWTDVAVGIAFWGGLLAAVLLLFRRRQATMLFAIALNAMLADTTYIHFMSNGREIMGPVGVAFGLVIIAVLVAQTAYCAWMDRRGVIV